MTSLTDRYVEATLRSIPARERPEIERELRAAIDDALESQDEQSALAALGDPARLAAQYSDRPLYLIGPAHFADYRRAVVVVLAAVVPLLLVVLGLVRLSEGQSVGAALWSAASVCGLVSMHILIWTTVVFAVIERAPGLRRSRHSVWRPENLRTMPDRSIDLGSVIGGSAMFAVITATLILVDAVGPVRDASGDSIGIIEPALWDSGALLLTIAFAAASIAFDLAGYYVGWSLALAFANLALSALFVACGVGLAVSDHLLNPAFFSAVGWPAGAGPGGVVTWIVIVLIVLISVSNVAIGFSKALAKETHVHR